MVTGVFVTLRARGAQVLVFHPRSSNLHATDLARAHAIAVHVVVRKEKTEEQHGACLATAVANRRL